VAKQKKNMVAQASRLCIHWRDTGATVGGSIRVFAAADARETRPADQFRHLIKPLGLASVLEQFNT
jgi:hypothetical protein